MLYNSEGFLRPRSKNEAIRKLYIAELVQKDLLKQHLLNRLQKPVLQQKFEKIWGNSTFRALLETQPELVDSWSVFTVAGFKDLAENPLGLDVLAQELTKRLL